MKKLQKLYEDIYELIKYKNLIVELKPIREGGISGLDVIDINTSYKLSVICGDNTYSDKDTFEIGDELFIPNNYVKGYVTKEEIIKRIEENYNDRRF